MYKENSAKVSGGVVSIEQEGHMLYDNRSRFIHNRAAIILEVHYMLLDQD